MQKENFAFLSINTTGCRPTLDRIFEIGVYYYDADSTLIKWHKFINPEIEIPAFIQELAEISDELIAQAGPFKHIANELQAILQNKIVVVHNALYKSSFLKQEMKNSGFPWKKQLLCMTKLLQELVAVESAIANECLLQQVNNYYAIVHAKQLAASFVQLLQRLPTNTLMPVINKLIKKTSVPLHITAEFLAAIPKTCGVYKFYGDDGTLLYVGKSVCLQERIKSHFTNASLSNKEMRIAQQIRQITWIETAGELGALMLEARLIKQLMPVYNYKLRRYKGLFTLELKITPGDYHRLQVMPCQQTVQPELNRIYGLFRQKIKAEQMLRALVKEHGFCAKLSGLEKGKGPCFFYQIKICQGACVGKESIEDYNARLQQALINRLYKTWPYSGAIVIKEICNKTKKSEYHIINQWCYIATVKRKIELRKFNINMQPILFDLDIYYILTRYLQENANCVLPLITPHPNLFNAAQSCSALKPSLHIL